jgi:hypothetical protein
MLRAPRIEHASAMTPYGMLRNSPEGQTTVWSQKKTRTSIIGKDRMTKGLWVAGWCQKYGPGGKGGPIMW